MEKERLAAHENVYGLRVHILKDVLDNLTAEQAVAQIQAYMLDNAKSVCKNDGVKYKDFKILYPLEINTFNIASDGNTYVTFDYRVKVKL